MRQFDTPSNSHLRGLSVKYLLLFAIFAMLLSAAGTAQSTQANPTTSDPVVYLNHALDLIETQALRRKTVDWPKIRTEAYALAEHATTTVGTYDAIRLALSSLNDHHSSLHLTPALQALEEQERAKHPPQNTLPKSPMNFSPYVGRYEPEGHLEKRGDKVFGYIVLTKCFPENDRDFVAFETTVQKILAELDRSHPAGWVVDLRGNVGGNMWPMLTGVGPLLGEGDNLGEYTNITNDVGHSTWQYRNGVAAELDNGKRSPYPSIDGAPYHIAGAPNVAVLIDRSTGSSGEAMAIAFRGRSNTRFFGEHTQGTSTVNQRFPLSDGADLWLTIGIQADRNGKEYLDGLEPDEAFPAATEVMNPSKDPVVQAALDWLNQASTSIEHKTIAK
jgi:hypothetical protein